MGLPTDRGFPGRISKRCSLVAPLPSVGMLVALADTHGQDEIRLDGRLRDAVVTADRVIHAGDFVTATVLDGFEAICDLTAVYGNNDRPPVRDRLPSERALTWCGIKIVVVHGHDHSSTGLSILGRQADADLVIFGHSHQPGFTDGDPPLLNPGSHAEPRWNRPGYAVLESQEAAASVVGQLREPAGTVIDQFVIEASDGE